MKQGLFMAMNYWLPKHQGALPLNAGCNVGADGGVALFLGLSGASD